MEAPWYLAGELSPSKGMGGPAVLRPGGPPFHPEVYLFVIPPGWYSPVRPCKPHIRQEYSTCRNKDLPQTLLENELVLDFPRLWSGQKCTPPVVEEVGLRKFPGHPLFGNTKLSNAPPQTSGQVYLYVNRGWATCTYTDREYEDGYTVKCCT